MTRFATVSCLALLPTTFSSTTSCSCNPRARWMFLGNWILPSASIRATILMSAIGYTPVSASPAPLPWQTWQYSGSWPRFVKRGGLEVLPYFPAHGREGEAAPLLRRNRLILLVQVAILMASRTLAKNQAFWQHS